jgi:DNA-binding NarL/FixJ family response regulator
VPPIPASGYARERSDAASLGDAAIEEAGPDRRRGGPDRRGPAEKTKILIVDDHALFRVGIRSVLEREPDLEIVGEADDPRSALVAALETSPDIILMDLSLPAPGGIEAARRIKRELPSAGIILLASDEDEDALFDAIKAGAAAFILKDLVPDDLVTIIRRVSDGEFLINDKVFAKPAVASRVLKEFRELAVYGQEAAPIFAPLSPREVQILDNIAQGMTNKQVGYALTTTGPRPWSMPCARVGSRCRPSRRAPVWQVPPSRGTPHDEPVAFKAASLALNPRARRAEPLPDLPNDHLPMTDCHDEAGSRRDTGAR